MTQSKIIEQKQVRPQTPQPPFPYRQKEVSYKNDVDGITVSGTLTIPAGEKLFSVVLLISGMGPQDRDYTMMGHKFYLVLADYLTRHGIGVLRVDKRGVGKSTGIFDATVTSEDLSRDVKAGIVYLASRKDVNQGQIGLIGHSEGGLIASMIAAQSKEISFLVLLGAVAATDIENVLSQVALQLKADGASEGMIKADNKLREQLLRVVKQERNLQAAELEMKSLAEIYFDTLSEELKKESDCFLFTFKQSSIHNMISFFNSPSYRYWLGHDPSTQLKNITIPTLALNGDLDFITVSTVHLPIISRTLYEADNGDVTVTQVPGVNHWFQSCTTGAIAEYGTIDETISPAVLALISDWILIRTNK